MYTYKIFDTVTKEFEDIFNTKNLNLTQLSSSILNILKKLPNIPKVI